MTTASCHPDSIAPASALEDLKIAAVWGVLGGLSAMALIPYVAQLMPEVFAKIPVPLWVLALAQGAQAAVILGMLAWLGLRMGHRVGLGSPVMHAWLVRRQRPDWSAARPLRAVLLGVAAGVLILALMPLVDRAMPPMLNPPAAAGAGSSAFNGFLASFYGGIAEELQLRLFLMTLLVWGVARLRGGSVPGICPPRPSCGAWTRWWYCAPCCSTASPGSCSAGCTGSAAWRWPCFRTSAPTSCCT